MQWRVTVSREPDGFGIQTRLGSVFGKTGGYAHADTIADIPEALKIAVAEAHAHERNERALADGNKTLPDTVRAIKPQVARGG